MISLALAQELISGHAHPLGTESVALSQAVLRVLAKDITTERSVPPFNRSSLDGFAFAADQSQYACGNQPVRLQVVGVIGAGEVWPQSLQNGECLRIMTGAPVPLGVDAVAAIEKVTIGKDHILIDRAYSPGEGIGFAGEDLSGGQLVMRTGTVIGATQIGILAAQGARSVPVYLRPQVAVIATGSELMPVESSLAPGKIYDSNSMMLSSLATDCGTFVVSRELVRDTRMELAAALEKALSASDVVITSGGVSSGDYDLTRDAVLALGAEILFHHVAMKPGAPMLAAIKGKKLLLCLSGNPSAAYVTFCVFGRPALLRLQGHHRWQQPRVTAVLGQPLQRKGDGNRFIRSVTRYLDGVFVVDVPDRKRSGMLTSLHETNSLIFLPVGTGSLSAGDHVEVMLIGSIEDYFM
jgi:molybdopterin molybdotransferase